MNGTHYDALSTHPSSTDHVYSALPSPLLSCPFLSSSPTPLLSLSLLSSGILSSYYHHHHHSSKSLLICFCSLSPLHSSFPVTTIPNHSSRLTYWLPYLSEDMWYVSFCVWLVSLSRKPPAQSCTPRTLPQSYTTSLQPHSRDLP